MNLSLTSSRVGAYLACPRRHQWAYEHQIRREQDGARLTVGTGYHRGLEAILLGRSIEEAASAAREGIESEIDREIAACMVSGWAWRWQNAPLFKRVLATEKVFEYRPVKGSRWTWAGKIDAIGELEDGRVAVAEFKTTTDAIDPESNYWRRLLIDRQISGYVLGARALGFKRVDTVMYDVAKVPDIAPRQVPLLDEDGTKIVLDSSGARVRTKDGKKWRESGDSSQGYELQTRTETPAEFSDRFMADIGNRPDHYYNRMEIPRLPSDLEDAEADFAHFASMIRQSQKAGRWPRNTDACMRWGVCPYFDPCSAAHDPEQHGLPTGFKRVDDVHVELTIAATKENANGSTE